MAQAEEAEAKANAARDAALAAEAGSDAGAAVAAETEIATPDEAAGEPAMSDETPGPQEDVVTKRPSSRPTKSRRSNRRRSTSQTNRSSRSGFPRSKPPRRRSRWRNPASGAAASRRRIWYSSALTDGFGPRWRQPGFSTPEATLGRENCLCDGSVLGVCRSGGRRPRPGRDWKGRVSVARSHLRVSQATEA